MNQTKYYLIVDTETSGIPKNWNTPPSDFEYWPFIIQIAWQIRDQEGKLIKKSDYFINPDGKTIPASSIKIHGITQKTANKKGESHIKVMRALNSDILRYTPTLIAHCVNFDQKVIAAGMLSVGLIDYISGLPSICTMMASNHFVGLPNTQSPPLDLLYQKLFGKPIKNYHTAIADCQAASDCFFEMKKRGIITENKKGQLSINNESLWAIYRKNHSWF